MAINNNDKKGITRKQALRQLGSLALLPVASSGVTNLYSPVDKLADKPKAKQQKQPNILFIMDDQHRGDFMGCAGAGWLKTPNLDKLAKDGARFSNFYCAVPSCTPARTSLLTGLSPWNHGMLGYMNSISQYYKVTMPQFFTEQGYHTIVYGKNHFGPPRNTNGYLSVELEEGWYSKLENGFVSDYEAFFKREAPGKDINATGLSYNDLRGGIPFPFDDRLHATHWTAEGAIKFLKNDDWHAPWFLKVSFQRPHPPFDPPKRWMDYYKDKEIPQPKVGAWAHEKYKDKASHIAQNTEASSGIFPADEIKESLGAYAGSISFVDEQIGRVLDALKASGQYENTFIVFASDHGDMMGNQHMWRKCRPYQPSANIPLIMRWPKNFGFDYKRGHVIDQLVELRDIFPTLADICKLIIPAELDGKSVLPLLGGSKEWRSSLCLEHSQEYEPDNAWIAIRNHRYKYIFYTLTGEEQFFDMQQDPDELNNAFDGMKTRPELIDLRNELVKEMEVRGPLWVKDGKLQVQKESMLISTKYPVREFNQHY